MLRPHQAQADDDVVKEEGHEQVPSASKDESKKSAWIRSATLARMCGRHAAKMADTFALETEYVVHQPPIAGPCIYIYIYISIYLSISLSLSHLYHYIIIQYTGEKHATSAQSHMNILRGVPIFLCSRRKSKLLHVVECQLNGSEGPQGIAEPEHESLKLTQRH